MTDRELAGSLASAQTTEQGARAHWEAAAKAVDDSERDAAVLVMRHAIALKRSLEQWVVARSMRAVR